MSIVRTLSILVASGVLAAAASGLQTPGGGSAESTCPDQGTTKVPPKDWDSSGHSHCASFTIDFLIPGIPSISFTGPYCPAFKYSLGAYMKCDTEDSKEGVLCAPSGSIEVQVQKCTCDTLSIGLLSIPLPSCSCEASRGGGSFTTYAEKPCND